MPKHFQTKSSSSEGLERCSEFAVSRWCVYAATGIDIEQLSAGVHPDLACKVRTVFGAPYEELYERVKDIGEEQFFVVGTNNSGKIISVLVGRYMKLENRQIIGISVNDTSPHNYFCTESLLILRAAASIAEEGSISDGIRELLVFLELNGQVPEHIVVETLKSYNNGRNAVLYKYLLTRMRDNGIISDFWVEEGPDKVSFIFPYEVNFLDYLRRGFPFGVNQS